MKTVIIGMGQIGTALKEVLKQYNPGTFDLKNGDTIFGSDGRSYCEILHICFPFSENFIEEVDKYQQRYRPKYTVIHSTVELGTSRRCGAIHSPIRGIHPHLEEGIRIFPKFLGGEDASHVADYFRKASIKVILFDDQETTEALKLFDTEYYKVCIEFAQRVKRFADKNNLNFSEIYTIPNITYNEGYAKLGMPEFARPVLQPIMKEIGGHCVLPNSELLKKHE